jgi:hypothetical protein
MLKYPWAQASHLDASLSEQTPAHKLSIVHADRIEAVKD